MTRHDVSPDRASDSDVTYRRAALGIGRKVYQD